MAVGSTENPGIDIAGDELYLETDFESSILQVGGQKVRRSEAVYSEEALVAGDLMAEARDDPVLFRALRKYAFLPVIQIGYSAVSAPADMLRANGLEFEAQLIEKALDGALGRRADGNPEGNYEKYKGDPNFLGRVLDNMGLVHLEKGLAPPGHVFFGTIVNEAEEVLKDYHKKARKNDDLDKNFGFDQNMMMVEQMGKQIAEQLAKQNPGLKGENLLSVVQTVAKEVAEELKNNYGKNGIDIDGDVSAEFANIINAAAKKVTSRVDVDYFPSPQMQAGLGSPLQNNIGNDPRLN